MVTVPVLLAGGQRRGAENHNGSGQAERDRCNEQPAVGFWVQSGNRQRLHRGIQPLLLRGEDAALPVAWETLRTGLFVLSGLIA